MPKQRLEDSVVLPVVEPLPFSSPPHACGPKRLQDRCVHDSLAGAGGCAFPGRRCRVGVAGAAGAATRTSRSSPSRRSTRPSPERTNTPATHPRAPQRHGSRPLDLGSADFSIRLLTDTDGFGDSPVLCWLTGATDCHKTGPHDVNEVHGLALLELAAHSCCESCCQRS